LPSEYTALGFNKQASGENENTWGEVLNDEAIELIDSAIRGRTAFTLSGSKTLTSTNGVANESRAAILHITGGTGGTVTIPDLSKLYVVINQASGVVSISAGGVTVAAVNAGETAQVVADGMAAVRKVLYSDFAGSRLTNVGNPVDNQDAATKAYVDAQAFEAVDLPGQDSSTDGAFLHSDGTTAGWEMIGIDDVVGLTDALTPASGWQITEGDVTDRFIAPGGLFDAAEPVAVAYSSTVTLDLDDGLNFDIGTLTGNITLANFTNAKPGQSGVIRLAQDATGGRTLTVGSNLKRAGGAMSLTPSANASDRIYYFVWSPTYIDLTIARAFA
jgi:hypothetical protein